MIHTLSVEQNPPGSNPSLKYSSKAYFDFVVTDSYDNNGVLTCSGVCYPPTFSVKDPNGIHVISGVQMQQYGPGAFFYRATLPASPLGQYSWESKFYYNGSVYFHNEATCFQLY